MDIVIKAGNHVECSTLNRLFRGSLCASLAQRPPREFSSGEFIFLPGDPARSIYFLRRGLVKTSVISGEGEELILAVHKPGEFFGELCLCRGERREQALAMELCQVVEIRLDELLAHLQQNRQAMTDFLTNVLKHLSAAYEQIHMLAFDKTLQRLARTLLKLAGEIGHPTSEGTELGHYLKQEELAQMIGATREVVSGSLSHLRDVGLVHYSRKGRITVNTQAMETYLVPTDLKS